MLKLRMNVLLIIGLFSSESYAAAGDAFVRGQSLYQNRCIACHSMDFNGIGPAHKGVFKRKVGQAADYAYSEVLKRSEVIWSEKNLDKWLANPEKFIPGQKMGFSVPNAKDRSDLIVYLKKAGAQ